MPILEQAVVIISSLSFWKFSSVAVFLRVYTNWRHRQLSKLGAVFRRYYRIKKQSLPSSSKGVEPNRCIVCPASPSARSIDTLPIVSIVISARNLCVRFVAVSQVDR